MKKLTILMLLAACSGEVGGGRTGARDGGSPGQPPAASPPASSPTTPSAATSGGRVPRRLSADQIRASFRALTGFDYQGRATVRDFLSPLGYTDKADAELLDVYGGALGRPDYNYTVRENLEPGVSFSKFVEDAARYTCGRAAAEMTSKLLIKASASDTDEARVRANAAALVLRFWGRAVGPDDEDVTALMEVFRAASTAPAWTDASGAKRPAGSVGDGWRAVCVALATDPQFYVY